MVGLRREIVAPHASVLIESMRDIGYSLQTAVADIIDNSITAGATSIELLADTRSDTPAIAILDNGSGMSDIELLEAMRPGTRSPLEQRPRQDLGRFGLGLKTSSFSQCRRLTVVSRKDGNTSCAAWDLDAVAETNEWYVEFPEFTENVRWIGELGKSGTLVVWEKLDRLVDPNNKLPKEGLVRQIDETASHLELVFHRFLDGEQGLNRISLKLNRRELEPFDPFHSKHPATDRGPEEKFLLNGREIRIQCFTLPHHKKVTGEEWERYAGRDGYVKNQGFYLYRQRRLIIHGTWFKLAKQTELTKLARVRIDMPNDMDSDWKVDIKKASAHPPALVRERLRKIIDEIGANSKRVYTSRGHKLVAKDRLPVWMRSQRQNEISYGLNADHPVFRHFTESLSERQQTEFLQLINLIESTIPVDTFFADSSSNPENIAIKRLDYDSFYKLVYQTYMKLKSAGSQTDDIRLMISSAEPFRANISEVEKLIDKFEEGIDCEG